MKMWKLQQLRSRKKLEDMLFLHLSECLTILFFICFVLFKFIWASGWDFLTVLCYHHCRIMFRYCTMYSNLLSIVNEQTSIIKRHRIKIILTGNVLQRLLVLLLNRLLILIMTDSQIVCLSSNRWKSSKKH